MGPSERVGLYGFTARVALNVEHSPRRLEHLLDPEIQQNGHDVWINLAGGVHQRARVDAFREAARGHVKGRAGHLRAMHADREREDKVSRVNTPS